MTKLSYEAFTHPKGKIIEEYFLQFKEDGNCFFLNENNGSYSCAIYAARPEVCKKYPSKPIQKEVCYAKIVKLVDKDSSLKLFY